MLSGKTTLKFAHMCGNFNGRGATAMLTRRMSRRKGKENAMTQFTDNRSAALAQGEASTTIWLMRAKLDALVAAMGKKSVVNPAASFTLATDNVRCHITLSSDLERRVFDGDYVKHCFGGSFSECFAVAQKVIADLPVPADVVMRECQRRVAAAIDYGTEHSVDETILAPLRDVSQTISDGLLTDQRNRKGDGS